MTGWRSVGLLTGALFATMAATGCSSSQNQYGSKGLSSRETLRYNSRYIENHDSDLERRVERDLGAAVLHDHEGRHIPFVQEAKVERVDDALKHLDTLGVNIEDRTQDARLVLSTGWDDAVVGKYFAAPSEEQALTNYYTDSSDDLFPEDPEGVMAVEVPSRRFETPDNGSVYAGTILHEAVHNQVAQLSEEDRENLYDCFREVGRAEYRGGTWDNAGAKRTWVQGWMSRYASKNIHEDVASTTTLLLNERSDDDQRIAGPGRIPYANIKVYMSDLERETGWDRIQEKIHCLHNHDLLFEDEYQDVKQAFSDDSVKPRRLGYDTTSDLGNVVDSIGPYKPK